MPLYEHVFLTRQDASAQQVEELTAQLKGVIEQVGGKITKTEQWGVKSSPIGCVRTARPTSPYSMSRLAAALNEIERQERLSEDVLRHSRFAWTNTRKVPRDDAQGGPRPRAGRPWLWLS
jgi:small subunit ribosomal protein S6